MLGAVRLGSIRQGGLQGGQYSFLQLRAWRVAIARRNSTSAAEANTGNVAFEQQDLASEELKDLPKFLKLYKLASKRSTEWRDNLLDKDATKVLNEFALAKGIPIPAPIRWTDVDESDLQSIKAGLAQINQWHEKAQFYARLSMDYCGLNIKDELAVEDIFERMKKISAVENSTIWVSVSLGIDTKDPKNQIRHVGKLPHGPIRPFGRFVVFCEPQYHADVVAAGAEIGDENFLDQVVEGTFPKTSRILATPTQMVKLARAAKILGPMGLMPSPKLGTLSKDIVQAVKDWRNNRFLIRMTKSYKPIMIICGRKSMPKEQLLENFAAVMFGLYQAKPEAVKKKFVSEIRIGWRHCRSVPVSKSSINDLLNRFQLEKKEFMLAKPIVTKAKKS